MSARRRGRPALRTYLRMMRPVALCVAVFAVFAAFATTAGAQDIEARAAMHGTTLPQAYHDRVAADPTAFELRAGWRGRAAMAATFSMAVTGELPVVVIPALFAGSTAPPAAVDPATLAERLFTGAATSTVSGYFAEVSRGKLSMRGTVAPWVQTSLTMAQVTASSNGLGGDARVGEWLREAVANADASTDFRQFDNDGPDGIPDSGDDDGRADAVSFLFHEVDAACGGPGIWPHRWVVSGWGAGPAESSDVGRSGNPIIVDDYIVLGAMECNGARPLQSNVIAHELGHVLGLPDYYDSSAGLLRDQRRWVVGCWDLMSAGSWGCGSGAASTTSLPTHMGPRPKLLLDWVEPTIVPSTARDAEYVLRPVRTTGDVLYIRIGITQHLLIEYRDRGGFDAGLPAAGVLAYRVQEGRSWLPCNGCPRTYGYALLEADGNGALVRQERDGGNRGEPGDAFTSGRALTAATVPSATTNNGVATTVSIHAITIDAAANVARIRLTTAAQPQIAAGQQVAMVRHARPTGFVLATGGAEPYQWSVQGTLPPGLTLASQRDRAAFNGAPTTVGSYTVTLSLRDALGTTTSAPVTINVAPAPQIAAERVVRALAGGAGLTAEEMAYLDEQGNRNGRYDVGDARAYLRRG